MFLGAGVAGSFFFFCQGFAGVRGANVVVGVGQIKFFFRLRFVLISALPRFGCERFLSGAVKGAGVPGRLKGFFGVFCQDFFPWLTSGGLG